jgi:hypothetical protein
MEQRGIGGAVMKPAEAWQPHSPESVAGKRGTARIPISADRYPIGRPHDRPVSQRRRSSRARARVWRSCANLRGGALRQGSITVRPRASRSRRDAQSAEGTPLHQRSTIGHRSNMKLPLHSTRIGASAVALAGDPGKGRGVTRRARRSRKLQANLRNGALALKCPVVRRVLRARPAGRPGGEIF